MAKNIGVLAAVAFVLGTQGVTAASISPSRLEELMASTSQQHVSLETLRARDRQILENLASSLAYRYSDLLAGSELIFTRLVDSGSVFYRLDFVGLKNKDRARALCEILEMERCIAHIGGDRLAVLEVRAEPTVAAIAMIEEEEKPFSFFGDEPGPKANPERAGIEARVRAMLDPLGSFPEPRPEMDFTGDAPADAVPAEKQAGAPKESLPAQDASAISAPMETLEQPGLDADVDEAVQDDAMSPQPGAEEAAKDWLAIEEVVSEDVDEPSSGARPVLRPVVGVMDPGQGEWGQGPQNDPAPVDVLPAPYELHDPSLNEAGLGYAPEETDPGIMAAEEAWTAPEMDAANAADVHDGIGQDMDPGMTGMTVTEGEYVPDEIAPAAEEPVEEIHEEPGSRETGPQARLHSAPLIRDLALAEISSRLHPAPMLRPGFALASHPHPLVRPDADVFVLAAHHPQPLARPEALASEQLQHPAPYLRPLLASPAPGFVPLLRPETSLAALETARKPGHGLQFVEVADTGDLSGLSALFNKAAPKREATIHLPTAATLDLSFLRPSKPGIEAARVVLPGMDELEQQEAPVAARPAAQEPRHTAAPAPLRRDAALASLSDRQAEAAEVASTSRETLTSAPLLRDVAMAEFADREALRLASIERVPAPSPLRREIVLADFEAREAEATRLAALERGADAPKPMMRDVALASLAPETPETIMIASMQAPQADAAPVLERLTADKGMDRQIPELAPDETVTVDIAMAPQANPERPKPEVATSTAQIAEQAAPRRRDVFEMAQVVRTSTIAQAPQAAMEIAQLGRVSFDDRYAQPAHVDFADGDMAGRLQKLPMKRPDLTALLKRSTFVSRPIHEEGDLGQIAMISSADQPFELAQVPSLAKQEETAPASAAQNIDAPFSLKVEEAAPKSRLDALLEGNASAERPALAPSAEKRTETFAPTDPAIFGAPQAAPVAAPVNPPVVPAPVMMPQVAPAVEQTKEAIEAPKVSSLPAVENSQEMEAKIDEVAAEQARMAKVIAVMSEIMAERDESQSVEDRPAPAAQAAPEQDVRIERLVPDESMRRRPAPRGPLVPNPEKSAAQELSQYESSFSDDRSDMQKAAHPQGQPSAVQLREQGQAMDEAMYRNLRIELSYVDGREAVMARVAELKKFFPAVMLEKGRFFGASIPEQPHRYMVGFAAESEKARDDLIWYLDQMGIPWAIR